MSMLIFIVDNKMNECARGGGGGGEFSRKLKIFKKICIPSFGTLCMI